MVWQACGKRRALSLTAHRRSTDETVNAMFHNEKCTFLVQRRCVLHSPQRTSSPGLEWTCSWDRPRSPEIAPDRTDRARSRRIQRSCIAPDRTDCSRSLPIAPDRSRSRQIEGSQEWECSLPYGRLKRRGLTAPGIKILNVLPRQQLKAPPFESVRSAR